MKKFFLNLTICILIVFAYSGCSTIPENVKNDISKHNTSSDIVFNNEQYKYIDIAKITEDFENALKNEYGHFELSKEIFIPNHKEIYAMEFEYVDNFCKNADEIFKIFFENEVLKNQTIINDNTNPRMVTKKFYNDEDAVYCCVGNNGFTAMLQPSAFRNSFSRTDTVIKTYHMDRGEISNDVYTLLDGECTIDEAVSFVNEWLNTKWKRFENYYDFSVKTLMVKELNGKHYFDFVIEKYYKGIPLNEISDPVISEDENGYPYVKHTYSNIRINMMNCREISLFTNETGIIKPTDSVAIDSIISLGTVLKLCETTITDFQKIEISDINLKYSLLPQYNYLGEETVYGNAIIVNSKESDTQAGVRVTSRPVWEIIIDVSSSEYGDSSDFNIYGDIKKYICVDAQNGEMYYKLSMSEVLKFAK